MQILPCNSIDFTWSLASAFVDLVVSLTQKSTFISIGSGKRLFLHNIFLPFNNKVRISAAKKPCPDLNSSGRPSLHFFLRTHGIGMTSYIHEKQKQNTHKETTALLENNYMRITGQENQFFVQGSSIWVRLRSKKAWFTTVIFNFQRNIFPEKTNDTRSHA